MSKRIEIDVDIPEDRKERIRKAMPLYKAFYEAPDETSRRMANVDLLVFYRDSGLMVNKKAIQRADRSIVALARNQPLRSILT